MFRGGGNFSCRHPKLWSYIKSNVKAFFITGVVVFTITASATTVRILHSRQVRYKNDKSVEQAINELYKKAEECEMKKIGCDGCTKLDYLENDAEEYIDTGIIPDGTLETHIKFMTNSNATFVYGVRAGQNIENTNYRLFVYGSKFLLDIGYGQQGNNNRIISNNVVIPNKIYELKLGNRFIVDKKGDTVLANDTILDLSLFSYNSIYTIKIFDTLPDRFSGYHIPYLNSRLYYCKIYKSDKIVRDYIPVLDKNKRPCLFDKVSKTCFYNQGAGEFLYE